MIRQENETGSITVNDSVYTDIVGTAAANCFGVTTPSKTATNKAIGNSKLSPKARKITNTKSR